MLLWVGKIDRFCDECEIIRIYHVADEEGYVLLPHVCLLSHSQSFHMGKLGEMRKKRGIS